MIDIEAAKRLAVPVLALMDRLRADGIPVSGVSRPSEEEPLGRIDFPFEATDQQRDAANALLASWDWTPADPALSAPNASCRLALIEFGIFPWAVDAAIAAIEDDAKRARVQTMWEYFDRFRSDDSVLLEMAALLGITEEALPVMFARAAQI
jgi:hypothetical protein